MIHSSRSVQQASSAIVVVVILEQQVDQKLKTPAFPPASPTHCLLLSMKIINSEDYYSL
jgi:hypothetical protein